MNTQIIPQKIILFEGLELHPVFHPKFDFLLSNNEVAEGYGVNVSTIRSHQSKNSDKAELEVLKEYHLPSLKNITAIIEKRG